MLGRITTFLSALLLAGNLLAAPTIRDVCAAACTFTTINTALAAAVADDIIEIRDSRTYDEEFAPTITITLRVQADQGYTPTLKPTENNEIAISMNSLAGDESVTVLGDGSLTVSSLLGFTMQVSGGASTRGNIWAEEVYFTNDDTNSYIFNESLNTAGGADVANTFKRCFFDGNNESGTEPVYLAGSLTIPSPIAKFHNCLFFNVGGDWAINVSNGVSITRAEIINCTVVEAAIGLQATDPVSIVNTIFANNTDDLSFSGDASVDEISYSAFEEQTDLTGFGAGCITISSGNEFVNEGADDYDLKVGADCIDAGTDTSGYGITLDIDGDARGVTYDMGAYEANGDEETLTMTPTYTNTPSYTDSPTFTYTSTPTPTFTVTPFPYMQTMKMLVPLYSIETTAALDPDTIVLLLFEEDATDEIGVYAWTENSAPTYVVEAPPNGDTYSCFFDKDDTDEWIESDTAVEEIIKTIEFYIFMPTGYAGANQFGYSLPAIGDGLQRINDEIRVLVDNAVVTEAYAVSVDTWYLVDITLDGAECDMIIDNVERGDVNTASFYEDDVWRIGNGRFAADRNPIDGYIDNFSLYDVVKTDFPVY